MKRLYFLLFLTIPAFSFSQINGDYRTIPDAVGVWSNVGIWEVYSGGSWVPASTYPNNIAHDINIQNIEFFEMDEDITLPVGGFLFVDDATVLDFSINAGKTLTNKDDGNIIGESVITVFGTYKHDKNGGTVPSLGNWDFGSTLEISGMTSLQPGGLTSQSFKTLNINSSGMTADFDLSGINFSELKITNTGTKAVVVDDAESYTQNITIESNGVFKVKNTGRLSATGTITNNGTANNFIIMGDHISSGSLIYNNAVSGTYQQYITAGVWHLIGIPVAQGPGANLGKFNPSAGDGYMRAYETANSNWGAWMTNESEQLNVGQGYEYWTTVNNTVSLTGSFNTGNISLTMSSAGNKYNLLSNPYPCALDWESVGDRNHAVSETIYYYDNTSGTNGYAVYNGSTNTGTYGATQYIPPFQGFFVEQTSATDMDFTNAAKAHPNRAFYKAVAEDGISDRIRIQIKELKEEDTVWSETVIVYAEHATNGYDFMVDTKMPANGYVIAPQIYSKADGENIMINGIGSYPAVVPLELNVLEAGIINLQVTEMSDMLPYTVVELEDRQTGTFYTLTPSFMGLNFNAEQGILSDRFFVHYSSTVGVDEQDVNKPEIYSARNIVYIKNNNQVEYDYQILNMLGQVIAEGQNDGSEMFSVQLDQPASYYLVKVTTNDSTTTEKLYISK